MKLSTQNLFKFMIGLAVIGLIIFVVNKKYTTRTIVLKDENGNVLNGEIKISSTVRKPKVKPAAPVVDPEALKVA